MKNSDSYENFKQNFGFKIKPQEIDTLKSLLDILKKVPSFPTKNALEGYLYDFCLAGNVKEFDLLKKTEDYILNIELKSGNKTDTEMEEQLRKNYFYLSKTDLKLHLYCFNMETQNIYKFDTDIHKIKLSSASELFQDMNNDTDYTRNIETLLSPEKFIISPFNDVDKFLKHEYLLTQSQLQHRHNIMETKSNFFITGKAGTGKTLLVYDLAKEYIDSGKSVLIIHGARLNPGHTSLRRYGFDIEPINSFQKVLDSDKDYDVIILDEMQRFRLDQISEIITNKNSKIILAGDPEQTLYKPRNNLENSEIGLSIRDDKKRKEFCDMFSLKFIRLRDKIRTNKPLADFILALMDRNIHYTKPERISELVSFVYFNNAKDAKAYLYAIRNEKSSKILTLPESFYTPEYYHFFNVDNYFENSFDVIGQEFNSVTTIVGPDIVYSENNKLWSDSTYYPSVQSLFQNITRTRGNLHFVIVDNEQFLNRLITLL